MSDQPTCPPPHKCDKICPIKWCNHDVLQFDIWPYLQSKVIIIKVSTWGNVNVARMLDSNLSLSLEMSLESLVQTPSDERKQTCWIYFQCLDPQPSWHAHIYIRLDLCKYQSKGPTCLGLVNVMIFKRYVLGKSKNQFNWLMLFQASSLARSFHNKN